MNEFLFGAASSAVSSDRQCGYCTFPALYRTAGSEVKNVPFSVAMRIILILICSSCPRTVCLLSCFLGRANVARSPARPLLVSLPVCRPSTVQELCAAVELLYSLLPFCLSQTHPDAVGLVIFILCVDVPELATYGCVTTEQFEKIGTETQSGYSYLPFVRP